MVVIEVLTPSGRVLSHQRIASNTLSIGRAYSNDIVLNDSYVDASHLEIELSGDGWQARDLSTLNGTRIGTSRQPIKEVQAIAYGSEIVVGKTHLRFLSAKGPIAPTRTLEALDRFSSGINAYAAVLMCALLISIEVLLQYFSGLEAPSKVDLIKGIGQELIALLALAGFWSLVGRLLKHETYFAMHLFCLSALLILEKALFFSAGVVEVNTAIPYLNRIMIAFVYAALAYLWLSISLQIASDLRPRWRMRVSAGFAGLLVVSSLASAYSDSVKFSTKPNYQSRVATSYLLFASGESQEEFDQKVAATFNEADELAIKDG